MPAPLPYALVLLCLAGEPLDHRRGLGAEALLVTVPANLSGSARKTTTVPLAAEAPRETLALFVLADEPRRLAARLDCELKLQRGEGNMRRSEPRALRVWLPTARERFAAALDARVQELAGLASPCPQTRLALEQAALFAGVAGVYGTPEVAEGPPAAVRVVDGLAPNTRVLAEDPSRAALAARQKLRLADEFLEPERRGRDPWAGRTGRQERAYLSEIDGSAQPYLLHVPPGYYDPANAQKRWGLVVFLHGWDPMLDKHDWFGGDDVLAARAAEQDCLLVVPFGRSNTDFLSVGEIDDREVVARIQGEFRIDRDRLYLLGFSMGGSGVWTHVTHYPDDFAAAAVVAGRTDYYYWKGLDREKVPAWKRWLIEADNPIDLAENLRALPLAVWHGKFDPAVQVEFSRRMLARLKELGLAPPYTEIPDVETYSHNGYGWQLLADPDTYAWLGAQRRPARPAKIELKTYTPKYGRSGWVEIIRLTEWGKPAHATAELGADGKLTVVAENVAEFRLGPFYGEAGTTGASYRSADGQDYQTSWKLHPGTGTPSFLVGQLGPQPVGLIKSAKLCGPVKEAFNGPFLLVYGTTGMTAETADLKAKAERMQREWREFAKGLAALKADTAVTAEDVRDRNLILYGTPATNAVLKRLAEKLPVDFIEQPGRSATAVIEILGKLKWELADRGLLFIYPNPENQARYVVVASGLFYGDALSINHKLDLIPDLLLFTAEAEADGTNVPVLAGFFDADWRPTQDLLWNTEPAAPPAASATAKPSPAASVAPAR